MEFKDQITTLPGFSNFFFPFCAAPFAIRDMAEEYEPGSGMLQMVNIKYPFYVLYRVWYTLQSHYIIVKVSHILLLKLWNPSSNILFW